MPDEVRYHQVANETPITNGRTEFLRTMVDDVRWLHNSRLVSAALPMERTEEGGRSTMTLTDPLASSLGRAEREHLQWLVRRRSSGGGR